MPDFTGMLASLETIRAERLSAPAGDGFFIRMSGMDTFPRFLNFFSWCRVFPLSRFEKRGGRSFSRAGEEGGVLETRRQIVPNRARFVSF
jgi:hypothetical protein